MISHQILGVAYVQASKGLDPALPFSMDCFVIWMTPVNCMTSRSASTWLRTARKGLQHPYFHEDSRPAVTKFHACQGYHLLYETLFRLSLKRPMVNFSLSNVSMSHSQVVVAVCPNSSKFIQVHPGSVSHSTVSIPGRLAQGGA